MEDIGLHPDYRSGVSDLVQCHICYRYLLGRRIETCAYCGQPVCPDCLTDYGSGVICDDCEAAEAG